MNRYFDQYGYPRNKYLKAAAMGASSGYYWYNQPGNKAKVEKAERIYRHLTAGNGGAGKRKRTGPQPGAFSKRRIVNPILSKQAAVKGVLPKMIHSKVKGKMANKAVRKNRRAPKRKGGKTKKTKRRSKKTKSKQPNKGLRASFEDFRQFSLLSNSNESNFVDIYQYLATETGVANNDTIGARGTIAIKSMIQDFRQGEATGFPLRAGLFDAPKAIGWTSTGTSTESIMPVNDQEVLHYDKNAETVYFTNGTNDVVHVKVQVFKCVVNSEESLQNAELRIYDSEQFFRDGGAAVNNPVNEPLYDAQKLPGLSKFWKCVKTKHYPLQPSMEGSFHYQTKMKYDQAKWVNSDAAGTGPVQFQKGRTHVIRVTVRGGVGLAAQGAGFITAKLGIMHHRYVVGHREELVAATKRQYINAHAFITDTLTSGATITEPPVTEVSGSTILVTPANF